MDAKPTAPRRSIAIAAIPLAIFVVLAGLFYKQLGKGGANSTIPSALIGKQAPTFQLPPLEGLNADGKPVPGLDSEIFRNAVTIVNVWASWCVPCRQEHPIITELAKVPNSQMVGINYKDNTENALRFLGALGNPYQSVGVDPRGKAAIDWGVYGIPETFLVGRDGKILFKHVGPVSPEVMQTEFLPRIEQAAKTQ